MSRASLTLLVSLSLGLGLTACGDDSSPGGGDTDTDSSTGTTAPTGPTTDTPTSDGPTTDTPTTGSTSTTDPDPDTGSETTDPTVGETDSETTGVVPMDSYFQVNSLEVRDPHLFVQVVGDSTVTVNDSLTEALTMDDPEDADGFLDLGFVLGFLPLDQADGGSESMFFTNASCTAPLDTSTCDVLGDSVPSEGTYTSSGAECYAPVAGNLGTYSDPPAAPMATAGPCFSVSLDSVDILAGDFVLPMTDVTVAATYVGNPAGNLVSGNIEGFISATDAAATIVPVPVFGDTPLADLLQDEDRDGEGWIFHIAFTAVPVEWTGA